MFKFKRQSSGYDISATRFNVGASTTITKGDAVVLASGLVVRAVSTDTAILGIAAGDVTTAAGETAICEVYIQPGIIWTVPFTAAGTKKTMAAADVGAAGFGLSTYGVIAPDDTTGPVVQVVDYNNTALTADVIIKSRQLF